MTDSAHTPDGGGLTEAEVEAMTAVVKSWLPVSYGGLIPRLERFFTDALAARATHADPRETVAAALERFADHDLHGLIPHSEIANRWYHFGLDAAQKEAREWAAEVRAAGNQEPDGGGK